MYEVKRTTKAWSIITADEWNRVVVVIANISTEEKAYRLIEILMKNKAS